jgi:hypothetical protein
MLTPPRLFDAKGVFQENVDTTGLDAAMLALLENVRAEYHATKAAEQNFADACAELSASERGVSNAKEYHDANFRRSSQHDLWIENFGNAEQRRDLARRRAGHA